jgi:hypothetical protein
MIIDPDLLSSAQAGKKRKGQSQLIAYLSGKKLTRQATILAGCYDCDGMGDSGECDLNHCALYPYSPYGGKKKSKRLSHPLPNEINPQTHAGEAVGTKETIPEADS